MNDDRPGTREELRLLLESAGLGPNQTATWLDSRSALLSGLIPSEAIANPATAARARKATRRLIAHLGVKVPDHVRVTAVRILQRGTYRVELQFEWEEGTEVRIMDLQPYLWGTAFDQVRTDYSNFAALGVEGGTVCWPGGPNFSPAFLYAESWPPDAPGVLTFADDDER